MLKQTRTIFKYKTNKGLLHKVPALLKLILLLPLSIICMSLQIQWLALGIGIAFIIAFICKFTISEQLTDLKPAFYYTVLIIFLSSVNNLYIYLSDLSYFSYLISVIRANPWAFFNYYSYNLHLCLRLVLIIQLSALLFRTTSQIEIREALCGINKQAGEAISLFLSFIPQIFENWSIINKAWKARVGKNGLRKIMVTIFILISISLEKAAMKAKALETRGKIYHRINANGNMIRVHSRHSMIK